MLLGGAAAWPLAARAQQAKLPVIGWLGSGSPDAEIFARDVVIFRSGLSELGFVEGENVSIEYRWAEGHYDRLPRLAADLVGHPVAAMMASGGTLPARAAKAATSTLPIVFVTGADPVTAGLVASLNRPGGNVTGTSFLTDEVGTKQLGLLRALVPSATRIALLVNPNLLENPNNPVPDIVVKDVQAAVQALGLQLRVLRASNEHEIDEVFANFAQERPDALLVQTEPFFSNRNSQIASLAARSGIPAISGITFAAAGGLLGYGASGADAYRQAGLYMGRILKGAKPADLPVVQSAKFKLVINLRIAKALGLMVPPTLLAIADEVIE
jgi:putative ABC transport system substrate-binding protein